MTDVVNRDGDGFPGEVTSFVGRRQATADVKRALSSSRLVTLIGAGGVGKSRLAVHVARELRRAFPDGVWLVELAKVSDPAGVVSAVAAALGLLERSVRNAETALVNYLSDKRLLLLLDNCEHVVDCVGPLAHKVLAGAPGVRVLATSREPLGMAAEYLWPVPPLSVPADEGTDSGGARVQWSPRRFEAMALFEDRAAAVVPEFALTPENVAAVARLCQRLDGVPLALELAATLVRVLSVEQILDRLERRFQLLAGGSRTALPRHQTLRAAVDWSYDLCTEAERIVWARCSVFAGEFDLDAAEWVCSGDGLTAEDVFSGVAGLVDKSVLTSERHGPCVRYGMLETIRQYGAERLAESGGEDRLRRRHRDYYLGFAERAEADASGSGQARLISRLRVERSNLWRALNYCVTVPQEARTGLRMASALWFYWVVCGFVRDGRSWMERLLALNTEPTNERARALWVTSWLAYFQGDNAGSLLRASESRELAGRLGDETNFAYVTQFLGSVERSSDSRRAAELLDEALARHRASGEWTAPGLLGFAQRVNVAGLLGDLDEAVALFEECEAICTAQGERWAFSGVLWGIAIVWWSAGETRKARETLREYFRIVVELDNNDFVALAVEVLAWVARSEGDAHRAAVLLAAAEKLWRVFGEPLFGLKALLAWREECLTGTRAELGEEAFKLAEAEGAQLERNDLIAYALAEPPPPPPPPASTADSVLTRRETEVAELVARGKANKEIASDLVISQRTAESHIEHILTKLGFNSRTQIAAWVADQRRGS